MITDKVKKELKEIYDYVVESETPLILKGVDSDERLIGICAEIILNACINGDSEYEGLDLKSLKTMEDNEHLLITGNFDYANEFDLSEWMVMNVKEFNKVVKHLKSTKDKFEICFGTNQDLRFENGKDLLNQLHIKKISKEEADILYNLFQGSFNGGSGVFDRIWEIGDNEEDEDEFFSKEDLHNIEFLENIGWKVSIYNKDDYMLSFTDPKGKVSISCFSMLGDLKNYYRKIRK